MSVKQTLADSKSRLEALLEFANNTTGAEDNSIGNAIKTLCDGFGQGGSGGTSIVNGEVDISNEWTVVNHGIGKLPRAIVVYVNNPLTDITPQINKYSMFVWLKDLCSFAVLSSTTNVMNSTYTQLHGDNIYNDGSLRTNGITANENYFYIRKQVGSYNVTYKWFAIFDCDGGGSGGTVEDYFEVTDETKQVTEYYASPTATRFVTEYIGDNNYESLNVYNFLNNTDNLRAGIKIISMGTTPMYINRVGYEGNDPAYGVNVYAGATIQIKRFKPIPNNL